MKCKVLSINGMIFLDYFVLLPCSV